MKIYIFGGGGTAKDVYFAAKEKNYQPIVVVPNINECVWTESVITDEDFLEIVSSNKGDLSVVIAISDPIIRKKIAEKLSKFSNVKFPNFFFTDPVYRSEFSEMGIGNIVFPGVSISGEVKIGSWNILSSNVWLPHDVIIEDFATIEIHAVLGGGIKVEEGATIGSGAIILPNARIGKYATVGLGSVILRDVPEYTTVMGNPARVVYRKKQEDE